MLAAVLVAISAAIALLLGAWHLYLTFLTRAFRPREAAREEKLQTVSPVLTSETTLGRSQVGFHARHSLGIILFGAAMAPWHLSTAHAFSRLAFWWRWVRLSCLGDFRERYYYARVSMLR
jgi:hypothetical protein